MVACLDLDLVSPQRPARLPPQPPYGERGGVWLPQSLNSFVNMILVGFFFFKKHSSLIFQFYNYSVIS